MNDELKYCKFCDKEKPIKEFVKSGFTIKNICRECKNKKQKEKLNASKNWNELKKWLEEKDNNGYEKVYVEDLLYKMQELEGNDE